MTNNLTYTANNRDGETWLVADNPYPKTYNFYDCGEYKFGIDDRHKAFANQHPDILLTDHLPDGTKVMGDEIEVKWQFNLNGKINKGQWFDCLSNDPEKYKGYNTRQVATLKQNREVVEDIQSVATNWFMRTGYRPNDDYKAYLMGFEDALVYAKSLEKLNEQN